MATRVMSIKISEDLLARLDEHVSDVQARRSASGLREPSRSDVVRMFIRLGLSQMDKIKD